MPRALSRPQGEAGFTLVELLIVLLIVGILAAIAVPAFLNQRDKANDASAKSNLRSAEMAEETYATDHDGTYTSSLANLESIEPSLSNSPVPSVSGVGAGSYTLTAGPAGSSNVTYTVTHNGGTVTRTCAPASSGGCDQSGHW